MRKLIIDCDPGQDDALMLFMALASPEAFDIAGICAVAGNVPLNKTERNARILTDLTGRSDIKVYAGCDRPMLKAPFSAEYVHGSEGIDGMDVFEPAAPLQDQHAVEFIIETLRGAEAGEFTLVVTGPMTNIGTAIDRAPEIVAKIDQIVVMGGAMREGGNATPSAEFNVFVDPHAAKIVFESGANITAFGLDVTHQVFTTPQILARIKQLGNPVADAAHGMLTYFARYDSAKYGVDGAPLHDPCTIAFLLAPSLFTTKACNVSVEADSPLTIGHTAVDFWHVTDHPKTTQWAYEVDREGFFELLIDRLAHYG